MCFISFCSHSEVMMIILQKKVFNKDREFPHNSLKSLISKVGVLLMGVCSIKKEMGYDNILSFSHVGTVPVSMPSCSSR